MTSQSLIQLQQLKECPNCNSKNINLYGDCLFCFDCKKRIENKDYNPNIKRILDNLLSSMEACGKWCKHEIYCRDCEADNQEALLIVQKKIHTCDIRLCSKPYCLSQRYSQTMKAFEEVRRLEGLKKLHHFSIGFDKISKEEFENNFDFHKKRFERVMNTYFKRLRKAGIKLQGFKVLDISFGKNKGVWDKNYFIHFHFAMIPFKNCDFKKNLTIMQLVRKLIMDKQRVKIPFHFQSYGLKEKHSLFSYIALRNIGLYKKYETLKFDNVENENDLIKAIQKDKWITLDKLVTPQQYVHNFFKKRNLSTIGNCYFCFNCKKEFPLGTFSKEELDSFHKALCPVCNQREVKLALPKSLYGSISADNMTLITCSRHGKFNINDFQALRHVFLECQEPPPPPKQAKKMKNSILTLVNAVKVEIIRDNELIKTYEKKLQPAAIDKKQIKIWRDLK